MRRGRLTEKGFDWSLDFFPNILENDMIKRLTENHRNSKGGIGCKNTSPNDKANLVDV